MGRIVKDINDKTNLLGEITNDMIKSLQEKNIHCDKDMNLCKITKNIKESVSGVRTSCGGELT